MVCHTKVKTVILYILWTNSSVFSNRSGMKLCWVWAWFMSTMDWKVQFYCRAADASKLWSWQQCRLLLSGCWRNRTWHHTTVPQSHRALNTAGHVFSNTLFACQIKKNMRERERKRGREGARTKALTGPDTGWRHWDSSLKFIFLWTEQCCFAWTSALMSGGMFWWKTN